MITNAEVEGEGERRLTLEVYRYSVKNSADFAEFRAQTTFAARSIVCAVDGCNDSATLIYRMAS